MLNLSWYIYNRRLVRCLERIRKVVIFGLLIKAIVIAHLVACNISLISSFITEGCLGMVIVVVESISAIGVDSQRAIRSPVNAGNLPILIVKISLVEIGWKVLIRVEVDVWVVHGLG